MSSTIPDDQKVYVQYNGPTGNHFLPSKTRVVRNYGYGAKGWQGYIYKQDLAVDPRYTEIADPNATPEPEPEPEPEPAEAPEPESDDVPESEETTEETETPEEETEEKPKPKRRSRKTKE